MAIHGHLSIGEQGSNDTYVMGSNELKSNDGCIIRFEFVITQVITQVSLLPCAPIHPTVI